MKYNIHTYQMRKESVSKDYFFLDDPPTTYTRLLFQETSWWTLLTVFLLRKFWWFGYFYCMKSKLNKMEWSNIFSVSTSDNDVNVMCHSEFISRVLSTPIPDPIMHFISEWDSDCVIELMIKIFSSLALAQTSDKAPVNQYHHQASFNRSTITFYTLFLHSSSH